MGEDDGIEVPVSVACPPEPASKVALVVSGGCMTVTDGMGRSGRYVIVGYCEKILL
jgi:hypothetical protein